jgi:hypothetical protein
MQARLQLRTASIRGIVFAIALGLATVALMVAILSTNGSALSSRSVNQPAAVSVGDGRSDGATQQTQHGNLSGGESDGGSAPSGGHGSLP